MKSTFLGFGQNLVIPEHWDGWGGTLRSAAQDAISLYGVAGRYGCKGDLFLSECYGRSVRNYNDLPPYDFIFQATVNQFKASLLQKSAELEESDSLFVVVSGHGGHDWEEYICFADGVVWDYELIDILSHFKTGVDIIFWFDLCHSGGMNKQRMIGQPKLYNGKSPWPDKAKPKSKSKISANVIQLCACEKDQVALDMAHNGAFTGYGIKALVDAWENEKHITYQEWFDAVKLGMQQDKYEQRPTLNLLGANPQTTLKRLIFT